MAKRKTTTKAKVHRFTVAEDCFMIGLLVENNYTVREVAQQLDLSPAQVTSRIVTLKGKGLRIERLNNTKEIVHISVLNKQAFNSAFVSRVNTLNSNVCVARENALTSKGDVKVAYKTWTRAELNTLAFFKTKSDKSLSNLFGRSVDSVKAKRKLLSR